MIRLTSHLSSPFPLVSFSASLYRYPNEPTHLSGGTRRITPIELYHPNTTVPSYLRLSRLAFQYSTLTDHRHCVIITYTDVEGDTITISTDHELTAAFEQLRETRSVVMPRSIRVQASFARRRRLGSAIIGQRRTDDGGGTVFGSTRVNLETMAMANGIRDRIKKIYRRWVSGKKYVSLRFTNII